MSLEMIGPVLRSMAAPLAATVIKSARSWIPGQRGTALAMHDRRNKIEIKNVSKSDLDGLLAASLNTSSSVSETVSSSKATNGSKRGSTRQTNAPKLDAANVVTQAQQIVVSPVFKLVFLTVVALTVLSGAAAVLLAFVADGVKPNQQAVLESMNTAWKLGLGAIFGLLGGKTG